MVEDLLDFRSIKDKVIYFIKERATGEIVYIGKADGGGRIRRHFYDTKSTSHTFVDKSIPPVERIARYSFYIKENCKNLDEYEVDLIEGFYINKINPKINKEVQVPSSILTRIMMRLVWLKLRLGI